MNKYLNQILIITIMTFQQVFGHPGGNMITVGKHVLWSYVAPIDDIQHHACVMIWSPKSEPQIILKSEFAASDYMFSKSESHIYIIEQRYLQNTDTFEIRIFKTKIGEKPKEIWPWFEDSWRIGDGGFFMRSDQEIIFGRYPNIYSLKKGQTPKKYFDFDFPVKKIRAINSTQLLLINDNTCWLTNHEGKISKTWRGLVDPSVDNAPLNRNQVFDADFKNGELLLAYWGNRSFVSILQNGTRKKWVQLNTPYVPHWVAFYGKEKLLFSSKMLFNGEPPRPNLILYNSDHKEISLWKE